jgi:hypothetical protein
LWCRELARGRNRRRRRHAREYSCLLSAAHAAKDSGIALELARSLGLDLPLSHARKEHYDRMIAEGLDELDKSGIAELTFKDRHKNSDGARLIPYNRAIDEPCKIN